MAEPRRTEVTYIRSLMHEEDEPAEPRVVNIIYATDGYKPGEREDIPACLVLTEDGEQCQYNANHSGDCSFDEQPTETEHDLVFMVLKERSPKSPDFEIIDGSGFLGLTAELEEP